MQLALDKSELSPLPRGSRVRQTILSQKASVYRLLKAHDLIARPAFIAVKAADEFKDRTTAPNQLWQTDFTYLKHRLGLPTRRSWLSRHQAVVSRGCSQATSARDNGRARSPATWQNGSPLKA